jgi:hypothetical protein
MKKMVLAILAVAALAASLFAREGIQLILATKQGNVIQGELMAVKHHTLVLRDPSNVGITVDMENLETISTQKSSHLLAGLGIGFAAGTIAGAGIGYAAGQDNPFDPKYGLGNIFLVRRTRGGSAIIGAVLGALGGALAGAVIGQASSAPQTIDLTKESPDHIEKIIVWLRSKARFKEESY